MKINVFLLKPFLLFMLPAISFGQATWNQDIAAIAFNNCTSCHHTGGIAPFSMMSYSEAVEHGFDIKNSILDESMPPWPPDENYIHFKDERVLSEDEINKIIDWASNGFLEGYGSQPAPPIYSDETMLDDIDETFVLPTYTVQNEGDEYRNFVIQTAYYDTMYIESIEFLPQNGSIIHHMFLHVDTTDESYLSDLADPLPGFNAEGNIMAAQLKLLGGWVPGGTMGQFPAGMALELLPGSDLVIQLHYAPGSLGESATPVLNFKWTDDPSPRIVTITMALNYSPPCLQEEELYIPANTVQTFHQVFDMNNDDNISLIAITPHMHYLGQNYKVYAVSAELDTVPLVYVDDWDFHWQSTYTFQKLLPLKNGPVIYGVGDYDNTVNNEDNPNDPPIDVYAGGRTVDEMMVCFFSYVDYKKGDENVVVDSTAFFSSITEPEEAARFKVFPNPATNSLHLLNQSNSGEQIQIEITNTEGGIVMRKLLGPSSQQSIPIDQLKPGIYFIYITQENTRWAGKFIKM